MGVSRSNMLDRKRVLITILLGLWLMTVAASETLPFEIQSADGTGNNKKNHRWGSAGSPFLRSVPPVYGSNQAPNGLNRTNPRVLSNLIFGRQPDLQNPEGISDLLPAWGIMLHLDVTVLARNKSDPFHIPVPVGDPIFDPNSLGNQSIGFFRSNYIGIDTTSNSRIITNDFTSFIDASGLYGNSDKEHANMRAYQGGLLKSIQIGSLGEFAPRYTNGSLKGHFMFNVDSINMVPQLTVLYTLFLREHNRRARELAFRHPEWSDEMLFQRARRWLISVIQKLTAYFYVPDLTGEPLPPYKAYNPDIDSSIDLVFANIAFRYGHSATNNLVLRLDNYGNQIPEGHLLLSQTFFTDNCNHLAATGIEPVLRGFAVQRDQIVTAKYVDQMRNRLPIPQAPVPNNWYDLAAVGIFRARELGIPDYNSCRKAWNLTTAKTWSDITSDPELQDLLSRVFQNIDDVDPYVGAFSEDHATPNSLLGPLMRTILRDQFIRLRDGDRFWFENPGVLTDEDAQDLFSFTLGTMVTLNTKIPFYPNDPFVAINASSMYFINGPLSSSLPQSTGSSSSLSVLGTLKLSWWIHKDEGMIDFLFESNSTGWFGFGFGSNMLGADIYLCNDQGNGTWTVIDSFSSSPQIPQSDVGLGGSSNVINVKDVTNFQTASIRAIKFSRKLITGDTMDVDITSGNMNMIFAFSSSTVLGWHGAQNRISISLNLFSNGFVTVLSSGSSSMSLKMLHGITMYFAFAFVYPAGIYIARYYQKMGKWLNIHQTFMMMVTSNVFVAALTAVVGNYGDATFLHYKLGLAVVGLILVTFWCGQLSLYLDGAKGLKYTYYIRGVHRACGTCAYLLGSYTGYVGVVDITTGSSVSVLLPRLYACTIWIAPVCLFGYGEYSKIVQNHITAKDHDKMMSSNPGNLPYFDWEEVNNRVASGAKWIVINNKIYDVANFIKRHPGGPELVRNMIGLDATKYFYTTERIASRRGTLTRRSISVGASISDKSTKSDRELNVPKHIHSRFALSILTSMEVGHVRQDQAEEGSQLLLNTNGRVLQSAVMKEADEESVAKQNGAKEVRSPLSALKFKNFLISEKKVVTSSKAVKPVYRFRIVFPQISDQAFFKPGESAQFQFVDECGEVVTRSYTPIKSSCTGCLDFYIKNYKGTMTTFLLNNHSIRVRGPVSNSDLQCPFTSNGLWTNLAVIAAGTGITFALLTLDYYLTKAPRDPVSNKPSISIKLILMSHSDEDIFCKDDLDKSEASGAGAISVLHVLSIPSTATDIVSVTGPIDAELIEATLPKPTKRVRRKSQAYDTMTWQPTQQKDYTNFNPDGNVKGSVYSRQSKTAASRHEGDNGGDEDEEVPLAIFICGPALMATTVSDTMTYMGYDYVFNIL